MALEKYRAKRNFTITPEPRGKAVRKGKHDLAFIIQKHAASHLHYDFRLELGGVLLSWAVPKGPSLDPADKRLAMHVEDHPIEYGGFEGVIPEKQYGAGTVMLWDRGTWHPIGDPAEGYKKGHLKFTLDGEKLHGAWTLIRTSSSRYGGSSGKQAWLLIKERDDVAQSGGVPIVERMPDSVATGRSLAEIAKARSNVWESKKSVKENVKAGAIALAPPKALKVAKPARKSPAPSVPEGSKKAPMPATIAPMLTTLVSDAPAGDDWLHEVKYDGYRMVVRIERGKARLYSRTGKDWTEAFERVARDLAKLPVKNAWVDGEVVVLDDEGRTSFQALQNALSGGDAKFAFFAFDLMYRDGIDLRAVPLSERKRLLRETVGDGIGAVRVGPEVQGHGGEFFRQACSLSLEGAVCKRADSPYRAGLRTRDWVKVKCTRQQEMVIGGYTEPQGSRTGFGALMLGVYEDGKLRYAARWAPASTKRRSTTCTSSCASASATRPRSSTRRAATRRAARTGSRPIWSRRSRSPSGATTARCATRRSSGCGSTRRRARSCARRPRPRRRAACAAPRRSRSRRNRSGRRPRRRKPRPPATSSPGSRSRIPTSRTSPNRNCRRSTSRAYYEAMAPLILPHIAKRPLSLVRCPDGWNGQCFYQKNADKAVNAVVDRVEVPEKDGKATYMGASSAAALVALVQWGVIEIHPWGSRKPKLERPDVLIFDFDPDDEVPWKELVTAVGLLRTLLDELGLVGFLKTTGGKGLHVVLPIRATLTWDEAKAFTRDVAEFMVRTFGDRFTATVSKARRKGKIFIDYLRNAEGATAVAPYAVRARAGAPVANADRLGGAREGRALRLLQCPQRRGDDRAAQARSVGRLLRRVAGDHEGPPRAGEPVTGGGYGGKLPRIVQASIAHESVPSL
jgi:bifunctional non-homologous end joining protein LigD